MTDSDRALAPLDEARPAIDRLDTYTSPQELTEALEAIGQAVERSLRQLLRLDPAFSDDIRLKAQDTAELPFDRVINLLRQRDRISLQLGNEVHELRRTVERGRSGLVRAADADHASALLGRLRAEVRARPDGSERVVDEQVRSVTHAAVERGEFAEPAHAVAARRVSNRLGFALAVALGVVAVGLLAWYIGARLRSPTELARGVQAYEQDRLEVAEQHFRAALRERENASAELYLGRIMRRQGRQAEAAEVLNAARQRYPDDADIVRELGHLLAVDLNRPAAAAQAYRRAVELEPAETANWVALVRALRAAGDTAAEAWLARAPAAAQAVLRTEGTTSREVP
jgi:tetratricopeptide (TPR) repeat protein